MPAGTLDMRDANSAAASPLAIQLINLQGITGIFFGVDFIAVTKAASADWQILKPMIQASIMDFYLSGAAILTTNSNDNSTLISDDPIIQKILKVIEIDIRPGVARDGGDVKFIEFDDGVVYLEMHGACAGCPAAGRTLKSGIEKILQAQIPEILEVIAIN